ncbi:putative clathrin assembly protein At4g25940 [Lotus japonicus]|uniref:putative clathrin assembly protein At4g25940 n=1 Tax=Lotus japonicus TaxID=34305 RepID=UPI0025881132|nr:putative clathrin assembly protein At4g25940 [Lotus japonicus]
MGTFKSFRNVYGALKDSTKVGLAKVNSDNKELDIAVVKATSHAEYPPKERHVRKIFYATSAHQPRADIAYCIHLLSKRLSKTQNWIVAIKTLIVIHRILREGDPTFREDLVSYSRRIHFLQISNFNDDSSLLSWECSEWIRAYALFLEERLECYRILRYDIEFETKPSTISTKVNNRTRMLASDELLEQLTTLQKLLHCLIDCQPGRLAFRNYLIQYALALVLKESFKIYCALNDGIINLVDAFFDMSRYDAVKALHIYKIAMLQAVNLAHFYERCKDLDLARSFQFPTLRQPPHSFLITMEEYIKEVPTSGSINEKQENDQTSQNEESESEESKETQAVEKQAEEVNEKELVDEETQPKEEEVEPPSLISFDATDDLLGLNEINPKAQELEESNALALAIVPPGGNNSTNLALTNISGTSAWELALVTTPSNHSSPAPNRKMAGGFDKLLLDSLYEDENARRQLQLQNAGYEYEGMTLHNPFNHYTQHDPFAIGPPHNVQMTLTAQQHQQQQHHHQMMFQQQQQHNMIMVPAYQYPHNSQYSQRSSSNPFEDPLPVSSHSYSSTHHQVNYNFI